MKKIVVISGVTGAIGSTLLSEYAQSSNTVIYGISRKATRIEKFLNNDVLPHKTLICSLSVPDEYAKLFNSIDYSDVEEVTYIHAMGLYPFEVDENGDIAVSNDHDNDGINDETKVLTYDAFTTAVTALQSAWKRKTTVVIFGGIADKYEPAVHQSWWKTIKKVKEWSKKEAGANSTLSILLCNISSVLCPHEIITRPYVFTHTDADQTRWLHPYELARFVVEQAEIAQPGFREIDKFRIKEGFQPETYYKDNEFTPRKVEELY